MAREAGIYKDCDWRYAMKAEEDALKAFEALVRADEREACAKVADQLTWADNKGVASAIRARSEK
jgi:hypothetical protein